MEPIASLVSLMQDWSSHYVLSRWLFLRLLGLIFAIAFASLAVQIRGLIGSQGILPAQEYLDAVKDQFGKVPYRFLPTIFWWKASDKALLNVCWLGFAASVLISCGILEIPALIVAVLAYLSLTVVGQDFLSFQWDILLIETGFFSIFLAPADPFTLTQAAPLVPPIALFLMLWLLFRLMLESGAVKLSCGDETWRKLRSLDVHYLTQPLPHRGAWYAHRLPKAFQRFSVFMVFVIEIGLPFLIFAPAPFRTIAAGGIIFLMLIIFLSGNYNFFNLLTVALCVLAIDDAVWSQILPAALLPTPQEPGGFPWSWILHLVLAIIVLLVSVPQVLQSAFPETGQPHFITKIQRYLRPFHLINSYGLFRSMTLDRPEIIIEGSMDNHEWLPYEFPYKPGALNEAPRFVQPHQPRLDWQMWFAALGPMYATHWMQKLLLRLFEGSEPVLRLFSKVPFEKPPRYIRAQLYDYEFTDLQERKKTGNWWKRRFLRAYSPTLMRRS